MALTVGEIKSLMRSVATGVKEALAPIERRLDALESGTSSTAAHAEALADLADTISSLKRSLAEMETRGSIRRVS